MFWFFTTKIEFLGFKTALVHMYSNGNRSLDKLLLLSDKIASSIILSSDLKMEEFPTINLSLKREPPNISMGKK